MSTVLTAFPRMAEIVPEASAGNVKIQHFGVSEQEAQFHNLRASMHGRGRDMIEPGKYARLTVNGTLMMTDAPMERRTNYSFLSQAKGRVLVAGLGLGMILHPLVEKDEVTEITVIEKYPEVVALVGPTLPLCVEAGVVTADIFEWQPPKGQVWDTIYGDIWPNISTDNLKEITKLKRKFCRRLAPGGWMGAWVEADLRYQAQREKRAGW